MDTCSMSSTKNINGDNLLFRFDLGHFEISHFNISYCNCMYPSLWSIATYTDASSYYSYCMVCENIGDNFVIGDQSSLTADNVVSTHNKPFTSTAVVESRSGCNSIIRNSIFTENYCSYVFKTQDTSTITVTNCKYQTGSTSVYIGSVTITNSVEISMPNINGVGCVIKSNISCNHFDLRYLVTVFGLVLFDGKYCVLYFFNLCLIIKRFVCDCIKVITLMLFFICILLIVIAGKKFPPIIIFGHVMLTGF